MKLCFVILFTLLSSAVQAQNLDAAYIACRPYFSMPIMPPGANGGDVINSNIKKCKVIEEAWQNSAAGQAQKQKADQNAIDAAANALTK